MASMSNKSNISAYPLNLHKIHNALGYHNKIRTIQGFEFSLAKPHSRNPNHIYIKFMGQYIGKVSLTNNMYYPVDTKFNDNKHYNDLICVSETQIESVKAYGKEYGYCGICNKLLTVEESLERGIGPVCYGKMNKT